MAGRRSFRSPRAFLVRAADLGETDRRLTFFTEAAGGVTVVAQAAHRRRGRFGGAPPKAFALLLAGIRSLSAGGSPQSVGRKAEAAFLASGGWGPDLSACRKCGRAESRSFRFVVAEGRLHCEACAGKGGTQLSLGAVRTWRALQASSPSAVGRVRIPESILMELQSVIPKYLEWYLGKPLRSLGDDPAVKNP